MDVLVIWVLDVLLEDDIVELMRDSTIGLISFFANLILESMKRLDCRNPSRVAAVGDTQSDLNAAAEAKVGLAVGVLTGAHIDDQLKLCPHHLIIPGVGDLPKYLS